MSSNTINNKQLQAAGLSIKSNILVQFLSRGLTFVLGAVTLKYIRSSALLGVINVRLALLYTTLQFLSREPFRRACIGEVAKSETKRWPKIANTIWLGLLWSCALSVPLILTWQHLNTPTTEDLEGTNIEDYHMAVLITIVSVIVEMLAEPCFIYAQARAISDHNPKVEMTTVTTKCILTAAVTVLESAQYRSGRSSHILSKVAICQLTASVVLVFYSYIRLCSKFDIPMSKFLPRLQNSKKSDDESFLDRNLDSTSLKLSASFVSQTLLKQLLTGGERYIMTFFNVISLSEQGIYDVVNNLGSLAARLVFKPIEDSGYTLFSQTVSRKETLDIRKFYRVQENLMLLIKSMLLVGLMVLTFGYNFVPLVVIYGGEKLNNSLAFRLMRWQLLYTPFLAVNGITECFTFAVMNTQEIRSYNMSMIAYTLILLMTIYLSQSALGSASFILANCLTMLSRIVFSYKLIGRYFNKHGYEFKLLDALPSLTTIISLSGVFIFLRISQDYLLDMLQPISVTFGLILGGWCLVFMIHVIMCHEEALLDFASRLFKR